MEAKDLGQLVQKAEELAKRFADRNQDADVLEQDVTVFLAVEVPLDHQTMIGEFLYTACMTEVRNTRTALQVIAAVCAKAAGKAEECLETLRAWFGENNVFQEAVVILTTSQRAAALRAPTAVVAA